MLFMDKNDLIWFVELCLMHILQIIGPPFIKEETGGNHILPQRQDMAWKQKHPLPREATEKREKKCRIYYSADSQIQK